MIMDEKVNFILKSYKESINNVREALEVAKVPRSLAELYMVNLPDFEKMIPDDAVSLYKEIQIMLILYLHNIVGLSYREIVRRTGGNSVGGIKNIIDKYTKKPSVVNPDEVSKKSLEVET